MSASEPAEAPPAQDARRYLELPFKVAGGLCVFAIMMLTTVDVVARYIFAAPINGAYEFVQLLLALVAFCGLPLATLRGTHITVGVFAAATRGRAGRLLGIGFLIVIAIILAAITQRLWQLADLVGRGDQTLGALAIPLSPLYHVLAVLAGITTLSVLLVMIPAKFRAANSSEHTHRIE